MYRNTRQYGRKTTGAKEPLTLDVLNAKRIEFISQNMTHDYVRCLLKNGAVYCGYIRSMDRKLTSFVLYHPYIEKSTIHYTQPSPTRELTVLFSDILKVTTHKTINRNHEEREPKTLSGGILDALAMADTNTTTFDDSERRQRARNNQNYRELESNFEFLIDQEGKGLDEEEYHKGGYDQFAENKEKFGVKSEFDITLYTTDVDQNEVPMELREAAARMEQEMKMTTSFNVHVLEERGVSVNATEEELYSKVHVNEPVKREGRRRYPPKEEKVLSRAIMKHTPKEETEPIKLTPSTESSSSVRSTPKSDGEQKKEPRLNASAPEFVFKTNNTRVMPVISNPMMSNQVMHVFIPPNQMMMRGQVMPVQVMPSPIMPGQQPVVNAQVSPQQPVVSGQQVSPQQPVINGQQVSLQQPVINGQQVSIQQPVMNGQQVSLQQPVVNGQVMSSVPVYPVPYQVVRPVYPVGNNQFIVQPQPYQVIQTQPGNQMNHK